VFTITPAHASQKRPFLIHLAGAGAAVGETPEAFTILTTQPSPDVAPIHDRQMVILERTDWAAWLDLTRPEACRRDRCRSNRSVDSGSFLDRRLRHATQYYS
jgi:putative SOS response-associated peptidase YedK